MNILTTDKIIEIFCIVDDFCKEYSKSIKKHQILPSDGNTKTVSKQPKI